MAVVLCLFYSSQGYIADVLISFSLNWLWHCLENVLFFSGRTLEEIDKNNEKSLDDLDNDV